MNVFSSCPSSSPARGRSCPSLMFVLTSGWPSSTWGRPLPLLRLSSPRHPPGHLLRPHLRLHAIIRLLLDSHPVATTATVAVVGAALAAPKAVHRAVLHQPHRSGHRCSTPGPVPSTCGQGPPPAAPVALHHAQSSQHQRCSRALMAGVPPAYFAPPPAPGSYPQPPQAPPAWAPWTPEGLASAFSTATLNPPTSSSDWVIDSGASSHITANPGMVTVSPCSSFPSSIVVGNGATLLVIGTSYAVLPGPFRLDNVFVAPDIIKNLLSVRKFGYAVLPGPFRLDNIFVAPDIIKNLLSVRKFTTDNFISIEFDPLGVSVKDRRTQNTLLRCNNTGPLYTLQLPSSTTGSCALVATPS